MNRPLLLPLALAGVSLLLASSLSAQPIAAGSATYTFENSFVTRLFPGTPFNMGTDPIDLPISVTGVFTQVWQDQVGDAIQDELFSIRSNGALPGPVEFEILAGADLVPELGAFTGSLTGITQDPGDGSLTSAFRTVSGPFAQVLENGAFLYTVDPYTFEANVTGLPFPVGTLFIGTADSSPLVRVRLGATIDPINDPVIGQTLPNGQLLITGVVPEPSAAVLLLLGAAGAAYGARRRGRTVSE